ncbi:MAG: hypothetical protein IJT08_02015 [Alphaproteobacteria bacterium]|nr:hypothetical protein [Alphaproteobacteria bacterium]
MRFLACLCFAVQSAFAAPFIPNVEFEINREIALFAQVYFDQGGVGADVGKKLRDEIKSSFGSNLQDSDNDKAEFVGCLASGDVRHKYMTPTFMELWREAKLEYDSFFDNSVDILNDRKQELTLYAEKAFADGHIDFKRVFDFYASELSEDTQFRAFIFPSNGHATENGTTKQNFAIAFGNNILLKFNYGNRAADTEAVLEQICQRLFATMPRGTEDYFLHHASKSAKVAFLLLDDVLAYVIGKKWVHSRLGELADSPLQKCDDDKLEALANFIFPKLESYLNWERKIDEEFCDEFIKAVELQFPEAYKRPDIVLQKFALRIESGIDASLCQDLLTSSFNVKEIFENHLHYPLIFIGKNLGDHTLSSIQSKIPYRNDDFLLLTTDNKGRLFILINTSDEAKITRAIEKLRKLQTLEIGHIEDL